MANIIGDPSGPLADETQIFDLVPGRRGHQRVETRQRAVLNAGKDAETQSVSDLFGPCRLFKKGHSSAAKLLQRCTDSPLADSNPQHFEDLGHPL